MNAENGNGESTEEDVVMQALVNQMTEGKFPIMKASYKGSEVSVICTTSETEEEQIVYPLAILITHDIAQELRDQEGNRPNEPKGGP